MIQNGIVILSRSQSIFRNLAFEDWLYKNIKCSKEDKSFLLMWRNTPAVVIGRHQNPWLECPVKKLTESTVDLARRNSGGGTVYHDLGNLNCSFFTPRQKYNRDFNLNVICKAMRKWGLNITVSPRHDLLWNGFKISGSASKLGRENAYHHCTLLLDVNHQSLVNCLAKNNAGIESKATSSIRSSVENLSKAHRELDIVMVIKQIGIEYQKEFTHSTLLDLDPCETQFPGIDQLDNELRTWGWIFGRTPRFTVQRKYVNDAGNTYDFQLTVKNGHVDNVIIRMNCREIRFNIQSLIGVKFTLPDLESALKIWKLDNSADEFVVDCIMRIALDVYS